MALLLIMAFPVLAQEAPTSFYSPEEAWELAHRPVARMVDETTCERIEGSYRLGRPASDRAVLAGSHMALFRRGAIKPFMYVQTRHDGVYVARFPAKPMEVIDGRSMEVDEENKRIYYGHRTWRTVCQAGNVEIGDPAQVEMSQSNESR